MATLTKFFGIETAVGASRSEQTEGSKSSQYAFLVSGEL